MKTVSGSVQSRIGEIEVAILRVVAGLIVSSFAELRQIATASADGSRQELHKPVIECDNLGGQCKGIGRAAVRGPREGINPIAKQIPMLADGCQRCDSG
jgi:hypothetical protein